MLKHSRPLLKRKRSGTLHIEQLESRILLAESIWTEAANADYDIAGNWDAPGVPADDADITFGIIGPNDIDIYSDARAVTARVKQGFPTFRLYDELQLDNLFLGESAPVVMTVRNMEETPDIFPPEPPNSLRVSETTRIGVTTHPTTLTIKDLAQFVTNELLELGAAHDARGTLWLDTGAYASGEFSGELRIAGGETSNGLVHIGTLSKLDGFPLAIIGDRGMGQMDVMGGGQASMYETIVGSAAGSVGLINVDGGLMVNAFELGPLTVGKNGRGTIEITHGGRAIANATTGDVIRVASDVGASGSKVIVRGNNSLWGAPRVLVGNQAGEEGTVEVSESASFRGLGVTLGNGGDGRLFVYADAFVDQSGGTSVVGTGATGNGLLTIGSGAQGLFANVIVGETVGSNGEMGVYGQVSHSWLEFGALTTATADDVIVGRSGTGVLNVGAGGSATFTRLRIGSLADGNGTVRVKDHGVARSMSSVDIGMNGKGLIGITNGGRLESRFGEVGAKGKVLVSGAGSVWNVTGTGSEADIAAAIGAGRVFAMFGGKVVAEGKVLLAMGAIQGNSIVQSPKIETGSVDAFVQPDGGDDEPIAELSFITDELDATAGMTLLADLRKVDGAVSNDVLAVTGAVALGEEGVLDASFIEPPEDIVPWLLNGQRGDAFIVLTAEGSLTGKFIPPGLGIPSGLPELPEGHVYQWQVIYDREDFPDPSLVSQDEPWVGNGTHDVVLVLVEVTLPDIISGDVLVTGLGAVAAEYSVAHKVTDDFTSALYVSIGSVPTSPAAPMATATSIGDPLGAHSEGLAVAMPAHAVVPVGSSLLVLHDMLLDEEEFLVAGGAVEERNEANNTTVIHEVESEDSTAAEPAGYLRFTVTVPSSERAVTVHCRTVTDTLSAATAA